MGNPPTFYSRHARFRLSPSSGCSLLTSPHLFFGNIPTFKSSIASIIANQAAGFGDQDPSQLTTVGLLIGKQGFVIWYASPHLFALNVQRNQSFLPFHLVFSLSLLGTCQYWPIFYPARCRSLPPGGSNLVTADSPSTPAIPVLPALSTPKCYNQIAPPHKTHLSCNTLYPPPTRPSPFYPDTRVQALIAQWVEPALVYTCIMLLVTSAALSLTFATAACTVRITN